MTVYTMTSNFNSCPERLCEEMGNTLRKDDCCSSLWSSTTNYLSMVFPQPWIFQKSTCSYFYSEERRKKLNDRNNLQNQEMTYTSNQGNLADNWFWTRKKTWVGKFATFLANWEVTFRPTLWVKEYKLILSMLRNKF